MDPSYKQTLFPGAVLATTLTQVPTETDPASVAAGDLDAARTRLDEPGQYLLYTEGETTRVMELAREWTRIRSCSSWRSPPAFTARIKTSSVTMNGSSRSRWAAMRASFTITPRKIEW